MSAFTGSGPAAARSAPSKPGSQPTDTANEVLASRQWRDTAHTPYTGPDRRNPVTSDDIRAQVWRAVGGLSIAMVLWTATVAIGAQTRTGRGLVLSLSHGITGALLLASAALALAVWRITGTTRAAVAVVGLALAGVFAPVMGILSRASNSGSVRRDLVELLAASTELVLVACAAALLLPPVAARLRPLRVATPVVASCILSVAAILTVDASSGPSATITEVASAMRIADFVLWTIVSAAFLALGSRRRHVGDIGLGIAFAIYSVGAARRMAGGAVDYHSALPSTGFALAMACAVGGVATIALWRLQTGRGTKLLQVTGELRGARTNLADLASDQARRLHDARNSIFAIAGATELLAHHSNRAGLNLEQLQRLITAELDHVGHLLDPGFRPPADMYSAATLLEPLVLRCRALGTTITATIDDCPIYGRREIVANAVTNILTNARVHAPGAQIWITARSVSSSVTDEYDAVLITIADDGPGIPASERASVLLPGVRGTATFSSGAEGSGLGLASAAQALSEVGGTLRLSERKGGGTMATLTIPAKQPARVSAATSVAHPRLAQ